MRALTLAASAAALLAAAPPVAYANEIIDISSYFDALAGYGAASDAVCLTDGVGGDIPWDAELQFSPSVTLDNGLTFGSAIDITQPPADPAPGHAVFVLFQTLDKIILAVSPKAGQSCYQLAKAIIAAYWNSGGSTGGSTSGGSSVVGPGGIGGTGGGFGGKIDELKKKREDLVALRDQVTVAGPAWAAFTAMIKAIDDHLAEVDPSPQQSAFSSVIFDFGLGYTQGVGDIDFGQTQSIDQDGGPAFDISVMTPVWTDGQFRCLFGLQAFGGQTDHHTLINPSPFPSSPLGGDTSYWGGGLRLDAEYSITPKLTLGAGFMVGAARVDFTAVQNGVTVATGDETVLALRGGLNAYYALGSGVSLGAGVSYTHTNDYDTVTNTGVTLRAGGVQDWAGTVRLRYEFGF